MSNENKGLLHIYIYISTKPSVAKHTTVKSGYSCIPLGNAVSYKNNLILHWGVIQLIQKVLVRGEFCTYMGINVRNSCKGHIRKFIYYNDIHVNRHFAGV